MKSAYQKLNRAKQHVAELRASIDAYRALKPIKFNPQGEAHLFNEDEWVIKYHVEISVEQPDSWGVILGDVFTNLRAALDHAVFGHAAGRNTLTDNQIKKLNFPIFAVAKPGYVQTIKFLASLLDANFLKVIESHQPFNDAYPEVKPVQVLNGLVNADKHRTLAVVLYAPLEFEVKAKPEELVVVSTNLSPKPMVHGKRVASITVKRTRRNTYSKWPYRSLDGAVVVGYVESIEVSGFEDRVSVLDLAEGLLKAVEGILGELKSAGC